MNLLSGNRDPAAWKYQYLQSEPSNSIYRSVFDFIFYPTKLVDECDCTIVLSCPVETLPDAIHKAWAMSVMQVTIGKFFSGALIKRQLC